MVEIVSELVALAAERFGDAPALVTRESRVESFAALATAVDGVAGFLSEIGVRPGDRVLIQAANSPDMIHAWLGAMRAGALPAAVNVGLTAYELDYLAHDLDPKLLLVDE